MIRDKRTETGKKGRFPGGRLGYWGLMILATTGAGWGGYALSPRATPASRPETAAANVAKTVVSADESAKPLFRVGKDCALCHSHSAMAEAMRDNQQRSVAPYDLWSGSMMANSAVDPYWRAAVSAEVAMTPAQKGHIEEVCSRCHAPMAQPFPASPPGELLAFLADGSPHAKLGKDGVSCAVCHQIEAGNLGTEASFTGGFVINSRQLIFGPHADPFTMPMQRNVGYTPTYGKQLLDSAMCATCHTVITGSFDEDGTSTGLHLHEQTPYLEWRNSVFENESPDGGEKASSCQACHVPTDDRDGDPIRTRLAHNPGGRDFPFLEPRKPFGRHLFAGGNVFMTRLIRDNRERLGVATPVAAFDQVIEESLRMLQQDTARLSIGAVVAEDQAVQVPVTVTNLAGHKFPTAYPARRAWIEVTVLDSAGATVFASGRPDDSGRILDGSGNVLPSELADGPLLPHFQQIHDDAEVQIYETLMEDRLGEITWALLRGSRYRKDNRLLPEGWSDQHQHAEATRPAGIDQDPDFRAGSDTTRYRLSLPPGKFRIEARLWFQSLSARSAAELLQHQTAEVSAFGDMYTLAKRRPELIAEAISEWEVPSRSGSE